jgi:HEAT repeat protein
MGQADDSMKQAVKNWQEGRASLDQIRDLAADLGNQHFEPGIPIAVELLDHEDEIVRYNAAMSVAFGFHHTPAAGKLLAMLAADPDEDCRRIAAAALGNLCQNTKDRGVLLTLAKTALNDSDEYVRGSAYEALLIVNGVSREQHLELLTRQSLLVDEERVKTILAEIS